MPIDMPGSLPQLVEPAGYVRVISHMYESCINALLGCDVNNNAGLNAPALTSKEAETQSMPYQSLICGTKALQLALVTRSARMNLERLSP